MASTVEKKGQIHEEEAGTSDEGSFHDNTRLEQWIEKDGQQVLVSWTKAEEAAIVRKADFILLPVFCLMFTWMAIDRTNVSGVLTSTFLTDTGISKDQANVGVSLLWLGIVLLEIPANVILHRIGPHYWIPCQVILWGLIEVMQHFVNSAGGWYAARLFLGLAESGFIPGSLYTLSRWYTQDELARRTAIFFFGPSLSSSFGSLISAGALGLTGQGGLKGWQWIFIICGVCTMTAGVIAFCILPESPHKTNRLFGGLIPWRGWLSDREADVYVARILKADPAKGNHSTMHITWNDISSVVFDWRVWPYLIVCLSGLQSVGGLATWGAVIIESLGFTNVDANLLNAPAPIVAAFLGVALGWAADRYKRFGPLMIGVAIWTLIGLIALFVGCPSSLPKVRVVANCLEPPCWQPINVTWLSLSMKTPQKRAIAYAFYIGCSNLGGTYGSQVFRSSDAPLYRTAWTACISLGAVWLLVLIIQSTINYVSDRRFVRRLRDHPELESEALYTDSRGQKHRYYW
ncbi:hypothetical protein ASPZODRAFT_2122598 [Penicilliopsis zonata CBS 506.65]|uniref:Major facilitator superfamily (MFS) profile domain-containing protein n=1 Tax=Penicilliopsis zonata CBS 506.65 TaxID=1073090 RepID=A0A1L9S4Y6_9EURO|nr:hypothetical protein ASPZODRAFT_2122598 [Penicilliopsis zonata CBS 506.65]OJJ42213.1 hypothetical protein ASPZODRAFT_2122598 [Penicilliopsis zonata CBS 506.65]